MEGLISINKTQDKYVQMYASDGVYQWFLDSYTKYPVYPSEVDVVEFIAVSPPLLIRW